MGIIGVTIWLIGVVRGVTYTPIMEKQMENHMEMKWKLGVYRGITYLWVDGNEGMEKKMESYYNGLLQQQL